VARLKTLSDLVARTANLRSDGHDCTKIAEILNQEGWRPAKRRDTFNAQMVRHLLVKAGVAAPKKYLHRQQPPTERRPDEWTIRELAETIGMPEATLYLWVRQGRLRSRHVPSGTGRNKLVLADATTIEALKAIRMVPAPWHRLPPSFPHSDNTQKES
jgi:hypothetical protein